MRDVNVELSPLEQYAARARHNDPATSHEAAASVDKIRESQQLILSILMDHGPLTDEQIYARIPLGTKMSPSGARTRRGELVHKNFVKDSGNHGLTASGRRTIIWVAVEQ